MRLNIVVLLIGHFAGSALASKENKLSLLTFISKTGQEPSTGVACDAAMRVVVNEANSRPDILPGYEIDMNVADEAGNLAIAAPRHFVNFVSSYNKNTTLLAPMVVGPSLSCQYVSPIIRQFRMTEFSHGCGSPQIVGNRNRYSNLYKTQMPSSNIVTAILTFAREVGKWNQIGIATLSVLPTEYGIAEILLKTAVANGFAVVKYNAAVEITAEFVDDFKQSDARAIVLIMSQSIQCGKFLCLGYKAGLRAPNYVFILPIMCYIYPDPNIVPYPKECTQEIMMEQLKITYWAGLAALFGESYSGPSEFGYDVASFEKKLDDASNRRAKTEADYVARFMCHDSMMAALVTLNKAEKSLRTFYNSSLKDFDGNPDLVHRVVNESAATMDFKGLRIGRLALSDRLEIDNEPLSISQFANGEIRWLFNVYMNGSSGMRAGSVVYDLTQYAISPFFQGNMTRAPIWFTKTGQPPRDLSKIDHRFDEYPIGATYGITVTSVFVFALQLSAFILATISTIRKSVSVANDLRICAMVFFASALIDLATIMLVLGPTYCQAAVILSSLSLTTLNALIMASAATTHNFLVFRDGMTPKPPSNARIAMIPMAASAASSLSDWSRRRRKKRHQSRFVRYISNPNNRFQVISSACILAVVIIAGAMLIVWLRFEAPIYVSIEVTPYQFDNQLDLYYDVKREACRSAHFMEWLAGLLALNVFFLLISCIYAYKLKNSPQPKDCLPYRAAMRLSGLNGMTILLAILLVAIITSGDVQVTSLAVGHLIYSLSTFGILFYPALKKSLP